jgi:ferric-dicitrate binding protein FerR (iron transport regulator)/TolA-binding protein
MSDPRHGPPRWTEDGDARWGELLQRVPDPEAPLGARQRVWRGLADSSPRPRRAVWLTALAGTAAAAALAVYALAPAPAPVAALTVASGAVEQGDGQGSTWNAAAAGATLREGGRLRTRRGGRAYLHLDAAGVLFAPETTAAVRRHGRAIEVALDEGTVTVADDPRPAERALSITRGGYTVVVLGTIFSVSALPGGIEVRVQEGRVQVRGPNTEVTLGPGQSWASTQGVGSLPLPVQEAALAARWVHEQPTAQSNVTLEALAVPAPKVSEAPEAPQALPEPQETPSPAVHTPAVRAPVSHAPSLHAPRVATGGAFDAVTMLRAQLVGAATREERERLSYELGKALAARGEDSEAVKAFAAAADGTGPRAELALYEVGRIELRHLSDPAAAADAFRRARTRFPQGQLGPELELSLIEALLGQRAYADASGAMDAFLSRYPDNERSTEVRGLRANLRREQGDCRSALSDYAQLDHGGTADDALYYSAFCKQKLGDANGARLLLERYQRAFPAGRHADDVGRALRSP